MSMSDPIADMLTRIRNAQAVNKAQVSIPASNLKSAIASVMQDEGYITSFAIDGDNVANKTLTIKIKKMNSIEYIPIDTTDKSILLETKLK